jgi:mitochondrial fission protein ELM1
VKNLPAIIWRLTDKRRGHDQQTIGLSNALSRLIEVETYLVSVESYRIRNILRRGFSRNPVLPSPHLIIGAGHQSQNALIAAKKSEGGLSICLMKPSLPRSWFDLCIIPEHDQTPPRKNTIETIGVLNPVVPNEVSSSSTGVILIGGPSRHHDWNTEDLVAQIRTIIDTTPSISWTITNSRRTPSETTNLIMGDRLLKDKFLQIESLPLDWINNTLGSCGHIWVSADSVSMIFEALSTRAKVGIIEVPAKRSDRINSIASSLQHKGWVYHGLSEPKISRPCLNEAHRCALAILKRWPHLTISKTDC